MYTLTIALLAHSHTPLVKMTIKKQVKTLMSLRSVTYTEIIEIVSGNKTIDEKNKHENEMLAFVKCAENTHSHYPSPCYKKLPKFQWQNMTISVFYFLSYFY